MKTVVMTSQKGDGGKTTLAASFGILADRAANGSGGGQLGQIK